MNISEHARILSAYLSRLTRKDLDRIMAAEQRWSSSVLNSNSSRQLELQAEFNGVILDVMGNMLQHDKQNITNIVTKIVNRETA